MPVNPELLEYYADRLILQYRNKDKARKTIQCFVNCSLVDGLFDQLNTAFDLDTAVGAQLTILGKVVGVPRNITGLDLVHTFFSFTSYVGEPDSVGFGSYADAPYGTDLFLSYFDNTIYTLTNFEMRSLIMLKILYNNRYSSLKQIVDGLWDLFGYNVSYIDNKDMTVTINVVQPYGNVFLAAEFLKILPKPMGVGVTLNIETALLFDESGNVLTDENGYPLYEE